MKNGVQSAQLARADIDKVDLLEIRAPRNRSRVFRRLHLPPPSARPEMPGLAHREPTLHRAFFPPREGGPVSTICVSRRCNRRLWKSRSKDPARRWGVEKTPGAGPQ